MNYPHDLGQIIQSRRQAEVPQAGNRQCTGTVASCHGPKLIEPLKVLAIQIIPSLSEQKNTFPPSPMFAAFSPRQPKSSFPQGPQEDMKIIYADFAGSMIKGGCGKMGIILKQVHHQRYIGVFHNEVLPLTSSTQRRSNSLQTSLYRHLFWT